MTEPGFIICMSREIDPHMPSSHAWCVICGDELWVSDTMAPVVTTGEVRPICMACADATLDLADTEPQIHPLQRPELAKHGILEFTEAMVEGLNREQRRRARRHKN